MIVVVTKLNRSERVTITDVETIVTDEELRIILVTDHSEPYIVDHYTETIDIVGV